MEKNTYWNNNGKYNHEYEILWRRLVPAEGKANTVAGEVLRAVSRLYYRWYNDGDRVTPSVDSWAVTESVFSAFNFLYQFRDPGSGFSTKALMEDIVFAATEEDYELALERALDAIIEWAAGQPDTPNEDDFLDKKFEGAFDFDIITDENDDW